MDHKPEPEAGPPPYKPVTARFSLKNAPLVLTTLVYTCLMITIFLVTFNHNPDVTTEDKILATTLGVAIALIVNFFVGYISIVARVYDQKKKNNVLRWGQYMLFGLQLLALVITAAAHMAAVTVEVWDLSGIVMEFVDNTMNN